MTTTNSQNIENIKQIIEDAEGDSLEGLQWNADRGEYLQILAGAGWEDDMAGVTIDEQGQTWIDGDVVAEVVRDARYSTLVDAGYSTEVASTQRGGFDRQAAEAIIG